MTKAVIFDMDGVLVDNRDIHIRAFELWCEEHKLSINSSKLLSYFGMGNDDIFPLLLERNDLTTEQISIYAEQKETIYREIFASTVKPVEGLIDLLNSLREAGIKMAVGSSGMKKNVDFVLHSCGIEDYFSVIVNGDMLMRAKPDPEVFNKCAERLGLSSDDCVVCEDSFAGIEAARKANMRVVVLATTFSRSQHSDYDLLVDDFKGLSAIDFLKLKRVTNI